MRRRGKIFPIKGFRVSLFEAVFVAALENCRRENRTPQGAVNPKEVQELAKSKDFEDTMRKNSTAAANVQRRVCIARQIIAPL